MPTTVKDLLDEMYAPDDQSFGPYRQIFRQSAARRIAGAERPLLAEGGGPQAGMSPTGIRGSDLRAMAQGQAQRGAMAGGLYAGERGAARLQEQDALAAYRAQREQARREFEAGLAEGIGGVVQGGVATGTRFLVNPEIRGWMQRTAEKPARDIAEASALYDLFGRL